MNTLLQTQKSQYQQKNTIKHHANHDIAPLIDWLPWILSSTPRCSQTTFRAVTPCRDICVAIQWHTHPYTHIKWHIYTRTSSHLDPASNRCVTLPLPLSGPSVFSSIPWYRPIMFSAISPLGVFLRRSVPWNCRILLEWHTSNVQYPSPLMKHLPFSTCRRWSSCSAVFWDFSSCLPSAFHVVDFYQNWSLLSSGSRSLEWGEGGESQEYDGKCEEERKKREIRWERQIDINWERDDRTEIETGGCNARYVRNEVQRV